MQTLEPDCIKFQIRKVLFKIPMLKRTKYIHITIIRSPRYLRFPSYSVYYYEPQMQTNKLNRRGHMQQFPSHCTNIDYLFFFFWQKNDTEDPKLDKDSYLWITRYIWKAKNHKLFKGIDRDPLETVRHDEAECLIGHGFYPLLTMVYKVIILRDLRAQYREHC